MKKKSNAKSSRAPVAAPVTFFSAVKQFWLGYVDFRGRATRREYWYSMLFVFIVLMLAGFVPVEWLRSAVNAILALPILMVSVRRYRDAGISGWFYAVPWAILLIWSMIRNSIWMRLLQVDYFAPDLIAYLIIFAVFLVVSIVVCCIPTRK